MIQQTNANTMKPIPHQKEIQELKEIISLLKQQMIEMKNLLKEVCKTVVTDESMKEKVEKTLNLIENQIPKEIIA